MNLYGTTPEANQLMLEGAIALAKVEAAGMRVDTNYLNQTIKEVSQRIKDKETELKTDKAWKLWKKKFSSNSKLGNLDQLTTILFDVMGFPYDGEKTATGRYKADVEVISKIDLPFVHNYVSMRKLLKVRSTYLEGILSEVQNGYLHPFFDLHKVTTYRGSSSRPNGQNFPNRNPELAKMVRQAFIPREGRCILEIDFKAIEVKISACYNKDPVLIRYIEDSSTDMHSDTAMELFLLSREQVDANKKNVRDWAKNRFVFPQFYGSVYFQCAPHIWEGITGTNPEIGGISLVKHLRKHGIKELGECDPKGKPRQGTYEAHCKKVEESFWKDRFKVYDKWRRDQWEDFKRTGTFRYYTGFTVSGISAKSGGALSRNDVSNWAIQGSSFHCLLKTLILLQNWMEQKGMKSLIMSQIHDSLIIDAIPSEVSAIIEKVKQIVSKTLPRIWPWIIVPMSVDTEMAPIGGSWYEKQEIKN